MPTLATIVGIAVFVIGVTLVGATFIVFANLIVDVLYAVVDPRVRG